MPLRSTHSHGDQSICDAASPRNHPGTLREIEVWARHPFSGGDRRLSFQEKEIVDMQRADHWIPLTNTSSLRTSSQPWRMLRRNTKQSAPSWRSQELN